MAILINKTKRVLVQGITGREGIARTRLMTEYGTQIVAGVTPGKGGQQVEGIPVFDTVREAQDGVGKIDISVLFIPAPLVKNAAFEALEAGIKLLVIIPDRVPLYDVLEIAALAKRVGGRFVGPNSLGILSPGQGVLGMMGGSAASARDWFFPGPVGLTSRSGGITTSMAYYLAKAGIGASTLVHVGGDAVVGLPHAEVLKLFENDPQTELVVMFGEIGTSQEEEAAALIESGQFTKPLVAHVGGKAARQGTRFSHAGAIIEGNRGTHEGKVARLREVGAYVVDSFAEIPRVAGEVLATIQQPRQRVTVRPKSDKHWKTAITQIKPNEIRLRGYRIDELMGEMTFSQAIYLVLTGAKPSADIGRMFDAILVSSIDHGVTPPSTLAARTAASTGAAFNAALAAGLLSINQYHGGAIENCMRMIDAALTLSGEQALAFDDAANQLVAEYRTEKRRLPGFGHRVHTADPRTMRLFDLADSTDLAGRGVLMLKSIASALTTQSNRKLPINVDGAIASVLVDVGIPAELGNTLFMLARVPGLIAQVHEEKTRERPMRVIHPTDHEYDGRL
jgi:succinyl-CoA synthetase alpha subunit